MFGIQWRERSNKKSLRSTALSIPIWFLILSAAPFYYEMTNHIPTHLIESSGILSVKKIGKNLYTSISGEQGTRVLTCASSYKGYTRCLPHEITPNLIDKEAKAFWYEQEVLPFMKNNKLVELYINGDPVITREMSEERMARRKKDSIYVHFGMMLLALSISAFFLKIEKNLS